MNNVQQIVTELNGTASADKVTVRNIIVTSILTMKQNAHWVRMSLFKFFQISKHLLLMQTSFSS